MMTVTAAGKNSVPACAAAGGSIVPPSVSLPAVRSCCNLSPGNHSGTGLLRLMGGLTGCTVVVNIIHWFIPVSLWSYKVTFIRCLSRSLAYFSNF